MVVTMTGSNEFLNCDILRQLARLQPVRPKFEHGEVLLPLPTLASIR